MILPAVAFYEAGYHDLVSVIPPDATLSPESKISSDQRGKAPGRRNRNGTWGGYSWRDHHVTIEDARRWSIAGANIGLRAARFPGLDIDSMDPAIVDEVKALARSFLGPAPERVGRAPKTLLPYRTNAPFPRIRLYVEKGEVTHLIEMLGAGQQFLIHGTHPTTLLPYAWTVPLPRASELTEIDLEKALAFFDRASEVLTARGYGVRREGGERRVTRAVAQDPLRAPSLEALAAAVAYVPNDDELFPGRDDYIRMGYAIRAAGQDDEDAAYTVFADWASRHAPDGRVAGNPETWRGDWRRMLPPYSVGWPWLESLARDHGYAAASAQADFEAVGEPPPADPASGPVELSDQWLADKVVEIAGPRLRYSPEAGRWYAWTGRRWEPDTLLRARDEVGDALSFIGQGLRRAATGKNARKVALKEARRIESTSTLDAVTKLVQARSEIAVRQESLDADHWILNTPSGAVDLRTGAVSLAVPDQLSTKLTLVGPDYDVEPVVWLRFLREAAGGSADLVAYLQRLAGYALTGSTREQVIAFIWGPGGNGKSVFLNAIRNVMGDYAKVAAIDTFTATKYDKHTTDLADLMGSRLVTASETQSDRAWDEQRVKQLSGGDPVKARFMRMDNFQFQPTFKLVFVGNHKPAIRDLDGAMRRRFHLVPFMVQPREIDRDLGDKLRAEYPAILAWMIEGALVWQRTGLEPPDVVRAATEEYLADEDALGRWLEERAIAREGAQTPARALFESWREWCGIVGEHAGSQRRLGQRLGRIFRRDKDGDGNIVYEGVALKEIKWTPGS